MTRQEIKEFAKNLRNENLWDFWKGFIICYISGIAIIGLGQLFIFLPLIGWIISIISIIIASTLMVGYTRYLVDIVNNYTPNINTIFNYCKDFKSITTIFLISIITYVLVALGYILLIVPGIILSFCYSLTFFIFFDNPNMQAIDILTKSRILMKGHKLDIFILILSFIGWILLSVLTFGILYIWVLPYMAFSIIKFYLNILESSKITFKKDNSTAIYDTIEDIKNNIKH